MLANSVYSTKNKVQLVRNGKEFINLNLHLIEQAKNFIWLHTYIFDDDEVTCSVTDALIKKANQGVKVFIIFDGFGSRFITDEFINNLRHNHIKFSWFAPIFSTKMHHIGRRLHSKILLVDNKKVLTGGINHSKKFCAPKNENPWLDYSILLEGEEVLQITKRHLGLYSKHFKDIKNNPHYYTKPETFNIDSPCKVRTIENDWMRFKNQIYRTHLKEVRNSQQSIVILATYFFPGKKFLDELKFASQRGVEIILIFTKRSDHPLERWSIKYLYSWFISQNFKIYEWEESIVHGKILFFDKKLCSIGSYNHNFMGHYGNLELNLDILNEEFSNNISQELTTILNKSQMITKDDWQNSHTFSHKLLETLSYIFANILTFVSLWFVIRRNDDEK